MSAPDPAAAARRSVLLAAAREFNAGRYFEAHEVVEEGLESVPDGLWTLHLGLIQVAVGYHKASQGLLAGAAKMLALGLAKLADYDSATAGVDLDGLRARVAADLAALSDGNWQPERLQRDRPRLRPLPSRASR